MVFTVDGLMAVTCCQSSSTGNFGHGTSDREKARLPATDSLTCTRH